MRINNNLLAMNTHRQLGISNAAGAKSMEKLSSGFRINRAGDDAAGLAISEKMRGQIRGLTQASRNAQDGISLIQTAEGALNETHAILQRMRELAVQSATDTNTDADRLEIQKEVDQLASEITRIAGTTQFNTMNLLDGTYSDKKFHIGANEEQNTTIAIANMKADSLGVTLAAEDAVAATGTIQGVTITASTAGAAEDVIVEVVQATGNSVATSATVASGKLTITLGTDSSGNALAVTNSNIAALTVSGYSLALASGAVGSGTFTVAGGGGTITGGADAVVADVNKGINVSTQKSADSAITTVNTAISTVSSERSKLGAMQNRLEHTIKNLDTSAENLQASESRIRDVDMAKEMMEQTKQNILQQAATAMLAQANQADRKSVV